MNRPRDLGCRLADEHGQSLVLALLVLTVLAIALGSVIFFTAGNERNANFQRASQVARSLAEAGVNDGVSVLTNPKNAAFLLNDGSSPSVSPGLLPDQANAYTSTFTNEGSVQWWGTFDRGDPTCPPAQQDANGATVACEGVWKLYGRSTVTNPSGTTAIHRTMTAKMPVYQLQNSYSADVWNWIYSPGSSGTGNCDTLFQNSLVIDVPVWVGGNLCFQNTVQINQPTYVAGYLSIKNPQAAIGSKSTPVSEAYVGAGCVYVNNPFYNPCVIDGTNVKGSPAKTNVFANYLYTDPTQIPSGPPPPPSGSIFNGVSAPPLCWGLGDCPPDSTNPVSGGWYSVASPGPLHPCDVASTSPAGNPLPVFDNNTSFDNSVPTIFNLTPDAYSYTCKTAAGELSWNTTTRTLTVQGVVFIDGSATATSGSNKPITYVGWGDNGQCTSDGSCQSVLFLSGTFLMSGEHLCAVVNSAGNNCDASAWDPNKKILIIATHGQGGQLSTGVGTNLTQNQTVFQGGLYAKNSITITSGAWVQGPLVSGTGTVFDGQSGTLSFPPVKILPFAINQPPALNVCDAAASSLPCRPYDYTG
jgi:hypothetical protein